MPASDPGGLLARGGALFDAGLYFEAHEVWEQAWLSASGARRTFLQGLIQVAAACHKASRLESPAGCRRLLEAGIAKLDAAWSEAPASLDLARFRAGLDRVADLVEAWERGDTAGLPPAFPRLEGG
jgi:predicted metal-dependent hydrolase